MKRLFVLLFTAIACGVGAMAQENHIATLQHGSSVQTFYGDDVLSAAHEVAVDGDIITLSSGTFKGCPITKAITIRGEGEYKTYITNGTSFTLPQNTPHTLTLEGLQMTPSEDIVFTGTEWKEKVVISKCILGLEGYRVRFISCNATYLQSQCWASYLESLYDSHLTCINSLINNLDCYGTDVQNCNLYGAYPWYMKHSSFKNTLIYSRVDMDATNTTSHCLAPEGSTGLSSDSWYAPYPNGNPNLWKNATTEDHHLTEEAAQMYIGTDGTQVGMFGGMYPYNEIPDYALVKKLDIIGSHQNGKLNVKINVE